MLLLLQCNVVNALHFAHTLPSINAIFFTHLSVFGLCDIFFPPHLRFCILFRVCAGCDTMSRDHFVWTTIKRVDGIHGFVCIAVAVLLSLFLSFVVFSVSFDIQIWFQVLFFALSIADTFANGGYLNDRHLKIIQFKSHFLAEIGNVDTFCCICCCCGSSSYSALRSQCSSISIIDSTSSHINKRAQCPENQIVWLSFASQCGCKHDGIPTRTLNKENNKNDTKKRVKTYRRNLYNKMFIAFLQHCHAEVCVA